MTGGPLPGTITLTFAEKYLGVNVPQVVVTPTGLTGGTVTGLVPWPVGLVRVCCGGGEQGACQVAGEMPGAGAGPRAGRSALPGVGALTTALILLAELESRAIRLSAQAGLEGRARLDGADLEPQRVCSRVLGYRLRPLIGGALRSSGLPARPAFRG